jgi:type I restriction enzyme R subunit
VPNPTPDRRQVRNSSPRHGRSVPGSLQSVAISSPTVPGDDHDYLAREARARVEIDRQLGVTGWAVQQADRVNFGAAVGVAVREFVLKKPHGRVDYLLFVSGQPVGVIEAKPQGTTLTEVERQSGKYVEGLPEWIKPVVYPLPFIFESTGKETRFTNGYDTDARSRRVFTFHRPETLAEWARQIAADPERPTFRARLQAMPQLDERAYGRSRPRRSRTSRSRCGTTAHAH